jgi:hypothetical protein
MFAFTCLGSRIEKWDTLEHEHKVRRRNVFIGQQSDFKYPQYTRSIDFQLLSIYWESQWLQNKERKPESHKPVACRLAWFQLLV